MSVTTELLLTRHGQARCNAAGIVGGPKTCTGLTDLGRQQVETLATRLRQEHTSRAVAALYAGPRRRLQESGQIIADILEMPLNVEPGLDGPDHGTADGRPWHEVKTAFRGSPESSPDRPWAAGSETWNGYLRRATAFLATLIERHEGERIVLAAHGETVIAAHTLLLGLPPGRQASFVTDHASLTRWQRHRNRFGDHRWLLAVHNDIAHLKEIAE
jgi:probable phosphoglycerate mutase